MCKQEKPSTENSVSGKWYFKHGRKIKILLGAPTPTELLLLGLGTMLEGSPLRGKEMAESNSDPRDSREHSGTGKYIYKCGLFSFIY